VLDIRPLRALYFPYSRCIDENTIKRAILMFDELIFIDPTYPDERNSLLSDGYGNPPFTVEYWKKVRDSYGMLIEEGIVKLHDPGPAIRSHEDLLGAAFKADLDDSEIWRICTKPGLPNTWSMLRSKVPAPAFDFLNPQAPFRIGYGTRAAREFFYPASGPEREAPEAARDLFIESDEEPEPGWLQYLFHDEKAERLEQTLDPDRRREILEDPEDKGYVCMFPFTHGSVLAVNTALLVADLEGLIPFTDSQLHHDLLNARFRRVRGHAESLSDEVGLPSLHPEKLRRITMTLLDALVPTECLEKISILEAVQYRQEAREAYGRFRTHIARMASEITSEVWDEGFEKELKQVVQGSILPEARKAKQMAVEIYEGLFGRLAKHVTTALTPTLVASIFSGISWQGMLLVGSAAVLGAALPDLAAASLKKRAYRRNSLAYLLEIPATSL